MDACAESDTVRRRPRALRTRVLQPAQWTNGSARRRRLFEKFLDAEKNVRLRASVVANGDAKDDEGFGL